jgi:putative transposase
MKVIRAYRFRLYPTEFQEELFRRYVGSCRWLYNLALEQRELFSRRGRSIGYNDQAAELKTLKADEAFAWLAETPNQCLQQVLMDLQKAFTNFFEGRASYPKRRKKFENDAFRFPALEQKAIRKVKGQKVIGPDGEPERYTQAIIDLKEGVVDLPKIGSVR